MPTRTKTSGPDRSQPTHTTRERLMTAAMRLVAEQGYDAVSVGAIEQAAGLVPRSGALYKHFKGKDELLRAAIEREMRAVDELDAVVEMLPLGDLRAELTLLARWNLSSLARRSDLTRLVSREAHRLPPELLEQLYEHLVDRPYARIVQWLQARYGTLDAQPPDLYPIALILTQTMSAYRSLQETFGRVPDGVDDERYIAAWVDVALSVAARYGLE
ncbi:MAG TPA: TetR/AcrR family transcriptional regulator [Solirubrobacteraceae bacterium]|jgi:AcrR family transcriptional regulator|nr:TetR/AcrR family transcriptional regulator [Solirubrobacteraceae bacterium]